MNPSTRKAQGVFYTPTAIARIIVDETLGRVMADRLQTILADRAPDERDAKDRKQAWILAWEAYREELKTIRVLDPACGEGVFLLSAFDALAEEHARVTASLAALRGHAERFDEARAVLDHNLFGVDLSAASVEITKRSLACKATERGGSPACLDGNIKRGDSLISFDWAPWRAGFDVVIGNPPYVRQELLTHMKDHLGANYALYHGMADIFVYFFERGLSVLSPGGRLGFIVTNKWLRAGYAGPLRRMLARETLLETLVDFGHAPIFPDADTFPCIITLKKPAGEPAVPEEHTLSVTRFPRGLLEELSIPAYVASHHHDVPQRRLGADSWGIEPPAVDALLAKVRGAGIGLGEFMGGRPRYGLKTGCNEAFLIDTATRDGLVREDPGCADVIREYLRGQDIARWTPSWSDLWIILLKSSGDERWPWTSLPEHEAEASFARAFPALHRRFKPREKALRRRADQGSYWWELRACAYYKTFLGPKIVYQEIQFHPAYALDTSGMLLNNKGFFLPTADAWLLGVLNSPLMWWYTSRCLPRMKDETLSPVAAKMEALPIAAPSGQARAEAERIVPRLLARPRDTREALELERALAALVNQAYGLTPPEIELMWSTAPPRMPAR